jgi:hypothetical protein
MTSRNGSVTKPQCKKGDEHKSAGHSSCVGAKKNLRLFRAQIQSKGISICVGNLRQESSRAKSSGESNLRRALFLWKNGTDVLDLAI